MEGLRWPNSFVWKAIDGLILNREGYLIETIENPSAITQLFATKNGVSVRVKTFPPFMASQRR